MYAVPLTTRASLKYAHVERELRFLLPSLPRSLDVTRTRRIHDRYLPETGLRLRLVEEDGQAPVRKLGQKVRLEAEAPSTVAHTTMYLSPAEYDTLLVLAADVLVKTRHTVVLGDGRTGAVDVFDGELRGLVTVELDLGADGERPDHLGLDVLAEVTRDERFTGGALARTTAGQLAALLAEHGSG
jgi:CYTH domain-containing protein